MDSQRSWILAHKWRSDSDLASLALCREALAKSGIRYADTNDATTSDAIKMHAQALVDAARTGTPALADLSGVAGRNQWSQRLAPAAWRFMQQDGAVHGIPVGIHRSNGLWANREIAQHIDGESATLVQWLHQASKEVAKPLLVAPGSWPAAVLFENVCLAVAGEALYLSAFERLDPDACTAPAMVEALAQFGALRAFVDDGRQASTWDAQFDGMRRREGAVMVMGDWVTARLPAEIAALRLADVPPSDALVVDYFVPLASADIEIASEVAALLTADDFQARFSRIKGCSPVLATAADPAARRGVPSLAFEQCCGVERTRRFIDTLSDHFHQGRSARATASSLAAVAAG